MSTQKPNPSGIAMLLECKLYDVPSFGSLSLQNSSKSSAAFAFEKWRYVKLESRDWQPDVDDVSFFSTSSRA